MYLKKKKYFLSAIKKFVGSYPKILNFISFFYKDILLNEKYKSSKFQKISVNKLKNEILSFQKLDNVNFKFSIKKINLNSFIFEKL